MALCEAANDVPRRIGGNVSRRAPSRILVVDDHRPFSRAFKRTLELHGDWQATAAPSLAAARRWLRTQRFSFVALDDRLQRGSGADLLPDLDRLHPSPPVLGVSAYLQGFRPFELREAGLLAVDKEVVGEGLHEVLSFVRDRQLSVAVAQAFCRRHKLPPSEAALPMALVRGQWIAGNENTVRGTWSQVYKKCSSQGREQMLWSLLRFACGDRVRRPLRGPVSGSLRVLLVGKGSAEHAWAAALTQAGHRPTIAADEGAVLSLLDEERGSAFGHEPGDLMISFHDPRAGFGAMLLHALDAMRRSPLLLVALPRISPSATIAFRAAGILAVESDFPIDLVSELAEYVATRGLSRNLVAGFARRHGLGSIQHRTLQDGLLRRVSDANDPTLRRRWQAIFDAVGYRKRQHVLLWLIRLACGDRRGPPQPEHVREKSPPPIGRLASPWLSGR